jgi:hypothetical protein
MPGEVKRSNYGYLSQEKIEELRARAREAEIKRVDAPGWTGETRARPAAYIFDISNEHLQLPLTELFELVLLRCRYLNIVPKNIIWRKDDKQIGTTSYTDLLLKK